MSPTHTAGPFVRVISWSFAGLVLKTLLIYKCHPRYKHLLDKPTKSCHAWTFFADRGTLLARSAQWFILVFPTCHHHRGSFSQRVSGVSAPRPVTRPATMGQAFSRDFAGTVAKPYVLSMLLLHIYSMLSFTFILSMGSAVSHYVWRNRQASTDFHGVCAGCGPYCLN